MSAELAEALQATLRLIDNVNERSMLNGLSLDITIVLAGAMRRQGLLSDLESRAIEAVFDNTKEEWPSDRTPKALAVLDASRALWDANKPR